MRISRLIKLGVVGIIATVIVGCGKTSNEIETFVTEGSGEINQYGWEIPTETINFKVYGGFGDQKEYDENSKKAAQFFKDEFNVTFDWTVYSTDQDEKLNLMLASNDYPEIITNISDSMAEKFIAQGRAIDITDLIAKYGDNINRRLGNYINLLKSEEGKIYKLPTKWGTNANVAGSDFAIRYDYFLETGKPIYTSLDEYYEVLKEIVDAHPVNANGEKVYALSDNSKGKD